MNKATKVLFIGSKQLGLKCLKTMHRLSPHTLVGALTFDDTNDSRSIFAQFQSFCKTNEVPLLIAQNRKDSEDIIDSIKPDICIVVGWYWLINNELLNKIPMGMLGIHNSLLPKYRGGSPLIWSIINGEAEVGFSMFSFTEEMDEGDIWFQQSIELKNTYHVNDVLNEIEKQVEKHLSKNYLNIINGELKPKPQNHSDATYCAQRKPEDGLIDWNKSAKDIYNFIRAQSSPYPGAYTIFKDKKIIVQSAANDKKVYYGTPGQVARISQEGIVVICGNHQSILIKEITYDGENIKPHQVIKSIKTRF
jgi:methionyl-tRNA formyltransferase